MAGRKYLPLNSVAGKADDKQMSKREKRIPTRCNNIDDLLSIPVVDY